MFDSTISLETGDFSASLPILIFHHWALLLIISYSGCTHSYPRSHGVFYCCTRVYGLWSQCINSGTCIDQLRCQFGLEHSAWSTSPTAMIPWHRVKRWTDALYINEREGFDTLIHCYVLNFITGFLVETSHCGIVYERELSLSERKKINTGAFSICLQRYSISEWWL